VQRRSKDQLICTLNAHSLHTQCRHNAGFLHTSV
jgi:hypothetical protein